MADLNYINYLNLVGYIINVLVTAFAAPIFNLTDNATLSAKYQTIITPAGFTFAIWGVIFLSQLIFTIYQMLPQHRSADIVQYSVGLMYFYACIAQSAWTFIFGSEILWLSVVAMFCILVSLSWIVIQQTKNDATIQEFWLFKFPVRFEICKVLFHYDSRHVIGFFSLTILCDLNLQFLIHFGWIFTAFLLNVNLFMVAAGANAIVQILSALISLVLVVLLAVVSLYFTIILPIGPFYTVPGVVSQTADTTLVLFV